MKEALRGRRYRSDEEVTVTVQNWLKTQPIFFYGGARKLRNAGTGALQLRGITLKSNISFVSVYLQ
jgi:hypothetical protein